MPQTAIAAGEGFTEEERKRIEELKALFRIDAWEFSDLVLERKRNHLNLGFSEAEWDTLFEYEQQYVDHVIELGVLVRSFGLKAKAAGLITEDELPGFIERIFRDGRKRGSVAAGAAPGRSREAQRRAVRLEQRRRPRDDL